MVLPHPFELLGGPKCLKKKLKTILDHCLLDNYNIEACKAGYVKDGGYPLEFGRLFCVCVPSSLGVHVPHKKLIITKTLHTMLYTIRWTTVKHPWRAEDGGKGGWWALHKCIQYNGDM